MIAALNGFSALAADISRRLAQAWPADWPSAFNAFESDQLSVDALREIDALIIVADRSSTASQALRVLDLAEEAGIPVMALLDGIPEPGNCFEFAGALVDGWSAPDSRMTALLRGLVHRQREIKRLRAEAAISQKFHGGLNGEIAKMHEELQLAAMVQREFLPREAPCIHGVEFAAMWRPTNYVSGDIYDIMRLDEDHVGVFVADAVGHGVPAALMTMVICRSLHTKEVVGDSYRIVPPSDVLSRLNLEMIRRQGRTTRFATAVYAVINCRRRTVELAGAGHPPPVRLSRDGSSTAMETCGGLLGVFDDETYSQISFQLDIDDRLLFYTDGFEQAFPASQADPYHRRIPSNQYRAEFDQLHRLPTAAEMIDVISRRLDDQTGSLHQIDDLTLVCLHAGQLVQSEDRGMSLAIDDSSPNRQRLMDQNPSGQLRLAS